MEVGCLVFNLVTLFKPAQEAKSDAYSLDRLPRDPAASQFSNHVFKQVHCVVPSHIEMTPSNEAFERSTTLRTTRSTGGTPKLIYNESISTVAFLLPLTTRSLLEYS